ncbi:TPA: helix-turn-helix domain-containing protein, partial [Escherichia coli]|nr:helix-turn-helix domain-containing protein [Escherichia coli]
MKGKVQCPLGQQRGRLTPLLERRKIISLIHEAVINGARKSQACRCIGISVRTLQRWTNGKVITTDRRSDTVNRSGFAPIFPDTCYHLTHYWPA